MSPWTWIAIYATLALGASFICSILEAVLLSTTRGHVAVLESRGSRTANHWLKFKDDPERPLTAILTLNTIAHTVGALGVGSQVEALDRSHDLIIPSGTQANEILRIDGAGLPDLRSGRRGDLVVVVRLAVPKQLTDEQQAKVKALAAEHAPKINAARQKAALSAEQKAARSKALKDNKAAGKKGKEARAAVDAASKLTDEQKAAMDETRKASAAYNAAVVALLSPEQKQKQGIKAPKKGKKKKDNQ